MSTLILVRHAESDWNAKQIWTGKTDIGLSIRGREQSIRLGELIADKQIDGVYLSTLKRAMQTFTLMRPLLRLSENLTLTESPALNERDYGIYTGQNKQEIKARVGDELFQKIRRGWDTPIEEGENLKQVYERVVPYYQQHIWPQLKAGKSALIVAHGNSLRALVKYLENIADEKIDEVECQIGKVYIYQLDSSGLIQHKEIKSIQNL